MVLVDEMFRDPRKDKDTAHDGKCASTNQHACKNQERNFIWDTFLKLLSRFLPYK